MSYRSIASIKEAKRNLSALRQEYEDIRESVAAAWKGDAALEVLRSIDQNLVELSSLSSQMGVLAGEILEVLLRLDAQPRLRS